MSKKPWIMVFLAGLGIGYGLALYFHPHKPSLQRQQQAVSQSEYMPGPPHPAPPAVPPPPMPDADRLPSATVSMDQIQEWALSQQWDQIIGSGQQLLIQGAVDQGLLVPHLEQAYIHLARAALDQGDVREARRLLSQAEAELGKSAPRLLLFAEVQQMQGDFSGALTNLHQVEALDPLLAENIYPLIRQLVMALSEGKGKQRSLAERIQLLRGELVSDPGYAPYYAILGRLYYEQGEYRQALTQLEYALQLDSALTPQLLSLIKAARLGLTSSDLVVVPMAAHRQSLYVDIKVNDMAPAFRFVLDTGASLTAISETLAQKLGFVAIDGLPTVELSTAKGLTRAPLVMLRSLDLQGARVENVQAVILPDLEGSDGLLGLSFLNHFNVDINHSEQKLLLSRRH